MRDERSRDQYDEPVETEGMGGAGGGDLDDVGDVGFPRDAAERDLTRWRDDREGMGGGDEIEIVSDMSVDAIRSAGREVVRGETGVVTGITTGVDTDDDTEGPWSPWENLDDDPRDRS